MIYYSGFQQKTFFKEQPFFPRIFSGRGSEIPHGFNVATILLEANERSHLNWKKEEERATDLIEKGFFILWEIDFALLEGSLEDEARFLTLGLAIDHFMATIWPKFQENTFGFLLFRGILSLSNRDQLLDYLRLISAALPDNLFIFLLFDTTNFPDPSSYFHATNQKAFQPFRLILKGEYAMRYPFALPALGWDHGASPLGFFSEKNYPKVDEQRITAAICLSEKVDSSELSRVIEEWETTPFRVIPEEMLTEEWEGIDDLMIFPDAISPQGQRKLLGFSAAGGRIIEARQAIQYAFKSY